MASLVQVGIPGKREEIPAPSRTRPGDRGAKYAKELAAELSRNLEGEVRFDDGSRSLYSTDASNYRQAPIGVVVPKHARDVIETIALCRKYEAPVLARGGGTSLAGQCCNVAVVMDCSKYMNRIVEIDSARKFARVQPGLVLDHLRNATRPHNLTLAPDPATHSHCTIGGMIGNNSCGIHALMGGKMADNTIGLDIVTYDGLRMTVGATPDEDLEHISRQRGRRGEIYARMKQLRDRYARLIRERYPNIPRRVSGYNLDQLLPENGFDVAKALVGSECTLVFVLEAKVRLVHNPPFRTLVVLGYPDIFQAADDVPGILEFKPVGLEGIDQVLVDNMKKKRFNVENLDSLPSGGGWLLCEFGGESQPESDDNARRMMSKLARRKNPPSMKFYDNKEDEDRVWQVRESGLGATAFVPGEPLNWPGWEDSAVPPGKEGNYLRDLQKLYDRYGYKGALYGHFGQGCVHSRISFDVFTAEGIRKYREFAIEAAHLVTRYGGSLSGEHGDGQARAELLPIMFGSEIVEAFNEFKAIWDPQNRMNPGKVVHPYRLDENLRLGADYNPPQMKTHFKFPVEDGWSGAVNRCVGVGNCRRTEGGTMCPSYMVTREEEHSTRGRSRMLFEMLQGEVIGDGWKSDHVFDALDLCLSCKGCKGDCPVNVDMATYKAEFLSHYYEGRLRPRYAYSMGLIPFWARLASLVPEIVNFATQTPGLSTLVKAAGGIAQRRTMPKFAETTFRDWFRQRAVRNAGAPKVLLWTDTFNNYFHPEVGEATVEVLEDAGFQVVIPRDNLCCGRPLYDYGMLHLAESFLSRILTSLRPSIQEGIPMVGMEPSCVATFRDELHNLFPQHSDGNRLAAHTYTLGEFLDRKAPHYQPPELRRKAVVHVHCHHHSIMKFDSERRILAKMGLDYEVLDSGCCGMAGSFGFEPGKYDLSVKCGERALLPSVRGASKRTIVMTDGFSCKHQIEELTDRKGLHLAQVLQMAKRDGVLGPGGDYPERGCDALHGRNGNGRSSAGLAIAAGLLLAGGALAWGLGKRRAAA